MAVDGQVYYITNGSVNSDDRVVRVDSDGRGQVLISDHDSGAYPDNLTDIGVDTAAGFCFAISNNGTAGAKLVRGSLGGGLVSPILRLPDVSGRLVGRWRGN